MSEQATTSDGVRLSNEQLAFLARAVGIDDLAGIGPVPELTPLEASVAARSLAARGFLVPGPDGLAPQWAPATRELLGPLVTAGPKVVAWVRHPTAGAVIAIRAGGPRATVVSRITAEQAWYFGVVDGSRAAEALNAALERGLSQVSLDEPRPWELGVILTRPDGVQEGTVRCWRASTADRLEELEPGEPHELVVSPVTPDELRRCFTELLGPVASIATPA